MADEKANAHSELLPQNVTPSHILRVSTNTASGNTKMFIDKMLSAIEITRAQAAAIDTANGGDGAWLDGRWYRITNPLTPLISVTMQALKDSTGFARLTMTGIANIATGSGFIHVECGYNPLTNTIHFIYEPKYNIRIEGTSSYGVIPLDDANFRGIHFTDVVTNIPNLEDAYLVDVRASNGTITITSSGIEKVLLKDISVTLSGNGFLLKSVLLGNGESIVFPAGYSATGKTFISGVSSNFTDSLDLSNGSIYKATGGGSGSGLLIIPANREWVGKFIFLNDYAIIEEINNLSTWIPEIIFQADIPSTFGGFVLNLLGIGLGTVIIDKIVGTALTTDLGKGSRSFDAYGAGLNQAGFAVITRQGDFNIYLDGKSIPTF